MPKYNIILTQGEKLPDDIAPLVKKWFSLKSIEKLEKFGGRIQISLTAPFKNDKTKIELSESFIKELLEKPEASKQQMRLLTSKQLKEVAKTLGLSLASKSTVSQIRNSLVQFLQTPEQWKGIAGQEDGL